MLILVGVWIFFMRRMNGLRGFWKVQESDRQREHMERVEKQLERIAAALEGKHGPGR